MRVITFVLLIAGSSLTGVVWVYATFETKENSIERKSDIIKRLDSIEKKLDDALKGE